MNKKRRFDVRLDPDAAKEYQKIDNSVIRIVDKAIDELEIRADEVGKPLGNKREIKLIGCREIKLRDAGIRIIFKIASEVVDILRIVYVLTIESRGKDYVFKTAHKRFRILQSSKYKISEFLKNATKWRGRRK
ncbi:MAG: type II toxin-antitoxin system RelE/ParE family toxin [Desulfotomaculaceae bacterium]|nr:type II toxin-antitoxin system RelE/ParE family toxin [Desulfotomaculaceae bacterium]